MKKRNLLSALLVLAITACSTPTINTTQYFSDLEKEYKSFSTKALSDAYVSRIFEKYTKTGEENPTQVIRQLEFARYLKNNSDNSYFNSLKTKIVTSPALYTKITAISQVNQKMSTEPATFGSFVHLLSPAPAVPTANPASNITTSSFTANWNSVSDATGYKLYIDGTLAYIGANLSFNATGLVSGLTHTYYVQATNSGGTSTNSDTISVTLLTAAPVATTATNVTASSFSANWTPASGATGYNLIIDNESSISLGLVTTYSKTGLTGGSTHSYYVQTINSGGTSSNSNTIFVTTIPSAPVATAATYVTQTSFSANWDSVPGATGYNLIIDNESPISLGLVTTYSKTGLTAASNHTYYLQAKNSGGTSANSNTITLDTNGVPVGEFQSSTTGDESSTAINTNGNFIIATSVTDVFVKLYNKFGALISGPQTVNTYTTGTQSWSSSSMDNTGNFVIAWTESNGGADGNLAGIFARRYNSAGSPVSEFLVNTYTINSQVYPKVAMNSSGSFVIVWQSMGQDLAGTNGIYAQKFNSDGTRFIPSTCASPTCNPGTGEFRVNTYVTSNQSYPSVAMNDSGSFVITWNGAGSGDNNGIFFQRYDSSGNPAGAETIANTYTAGNQNFPVVAMNNSGNFVIAWDSGYYSDEADSTVIAQRFNSSGSPIGGEFKSNTYTAGVQDKAAIGMDSTGNFVITWESNGQDAASSLGIYGQRFNSDGSRFIPSTCTSPVCNSSTGEFRLNTTTAGIQSVPKMSMSSTGDFVTSWRSSQGSCSVNFCTYAKRYDININEK